ncbi:bifunctional 5,10-methylenetetrahydrofolate dehydrogenase/5,10-methenyltetrahydrofolate cyclohydrolase [Candidatus Bipolaricaulota bacterium]|nr:bifunctional 5,10-methylenetetrahydrofolate dehydrogenase/5,10-methenyltetrahydrofolate cyclohydrolase [Candidatus Bipolaricaulota bacterium]
MSKLDGNKIAETYREDLKEEVERLKGEGLTPAIAPVLVGDDPGAKVYYRTKKKLAEKLGVEYKGVKLNGDLPKAELVENLRELNQDPEVHGLFIELPLPEGLDIGELRTEINPKKDVDCINPVNSGKLLSGGAARASYEELKNDPEVLLPATPYAVMEILKSSDIDLAGKEFMVVGGGAVGLPLSLLALREGYSTVSITEYQAENLPGKTRRADILCTSVGRKNFITEDMVSEGTVVVDVGINSTDSGITGDVDYENVNKKASHITPVPGGVGPMTTTLIMSNTVKAAKVLSK